MKKDKLNLNKQIKITLLSAMAFLLMYLEFPLPIFPQFLKIDLSDLPALIGAFALGPVEGVIIEFLKNVLHILFKGTQTVFVGELANFLVGGILVFTSGYFYKKEKTRRNAILGLMFGTALMTVLAGILNYYILVPVYAKAFKVPIDALVAMGSKVNGNIKSLGTYILWGVVPFNLIKGIMVSIVTLGMYKSVSPILHKEDLVIEKHDMAKKEM